MTFGTAFAIVMCGWIFNYFGVKFLNWMNGPQPNEDDGMAGVAALFLVIPFVMAVVLLLIGLMKILMWFGVVEK